jgi:hypothetical protein
MPASPPPARRASRPPRRPPATAPPWPSLSAAPIPACYRRQAQRCRAAPSFQLRGVPEHLSPSRSRSGFPCLPGNRPAPAFGTFRRAALRMTGSPPQLTMRPARSFAPRATTRPLQLSRPQAHWHSQRACPSGSSRPAYASTSSAPRPVSSRIREGGGIIVQARGVPFTS